MGNKAAILFLGESRKQQNLYWFLPTYQNGSSIKKILKPHPLVPVLGFVSLLVLALHPTTLRFSCALPRSVSGSRAEDNRRISGGVNLVTLTRNLS